MASLATHFTASLFLCPLGIRRLLCSISLYVKNPSLYRARIWYFSEPKWKNLDIYSMLIALPISYLSLVFLFFAFSGHPTFRFSFLQQSFVIFLFWVLLVFILLKQSFDLSTVPENLVFVFAGIAFLIEFYLSGRGIVGVAGGMYGVFCGLAIFCGACCLYLSVRPSAFFAEFMLCSGIVLKGTWVMQVGLTLYTDAFGLKGCEKISWLSLGRAGVDITCQLDDDKWRAAVLMNLLFIVHVVVVMLVSLVLFGMLHSNRSLRCGEGSGPLLAELGSHSQGMLMHPLPDLELE